MKRFAAVLAAAVVLCSLASRSARGAEMAEVVPANALVYVECSGDAAQAVLSVAALPPFLGMVIPQAGDPFGYVDDALRLPRGTARQAAPHVTGLALAVVDEEPLLLFALDEDGWVSTLRQGLKPGADGLAELWDPDAVCMARGNLLLLGSRETCAAVPAGTHDSLGATAAYVAARGKVKDATVLAFAAVPTLLDALRSGMPQREREGFDAFTWLSGLDKADYLVASVEGAGPFALLEPTGSAPLARPGETRLTLHFRDEAALLLRLLPQSPMRVAADAPADAAATLALNWGDAGAFVGNLRDIVTQMGAVAGGAGGQDPFAAIEAVLGVRLDEFAAMLGSGAVVSLSAGAGGLMIERQDWTAMLPLRDAAGFRTVLDSLARNAIGAPLSTIEHKGLSMMQLPMAPAVLAVTDDALVVSGSPENLARYLDWRATEGRASLAGQVGERPIAALLRADLGRLLVSYPTPGSGTKVLVSLARAGADVNLSLAIADVNPRQFYAEYMHGYSALMVGMLMPALHRARGEARQARGMSNLHNIGLALAMCRNDLNGQYPDSLAAVVENGYLQDAGQLVDPMDPAPQPIGDGKYRSSYEFVGSLPQEAPENVIVAYSRRGVYPQSRIVLSNDMAVLTVNEWQLGQPGDPRMSLQASYEGVVAAYGDKLTPEIDARLRKFYEIAE